MKLGLIFLLAFMLDNSGCGDNRSEADIKQQTATDTITAEGNRQVGMPGISKYTEKRIMRQLYELRDQNISTYAYVMDLQGRLWHVCDSIGFGLPYGVQFTAPERPLYNGQGAMVPQPEPNGLFMPPGAEGTWVICASKAGKFTPVYIEPRVIVSPFPLKAAGDYQE
jgi:hypothetical protein